LPPLEALAVARGIDDARWRAEVLIDAVLDYHSKNSRLR
jgi:hypothetical protein